MSGVAIPERPHANSAAHKRQQFPIGAHVLAKRTAACNLRLSTIERGVVVDRWGEWGVCAGVCGSDMPMRAHVCPTCGAKGKALRADARNVYVVQLADGGVISVIAERLQLAPVELHVAA